MIRISDLTKKFDNVEVLNIPQLQVEKGELIGIVGNNGAGKTTLLRLCLDLLFADSGTVSIDNENVAQGENWKKITGSYLSEKFLIDFLKPAEYFNFIGEIYGLTKQEIVEKVSIFEEFMTEEILKHPKKYIEKFSMGNKQKIGIVGAMLMRPRLLILDEPFNFLDPSSQIEMKYLLQKYNAEFGTTILLSSHNIQYIADICSRIIILEKGKVIRDEQNTTPEIKAELENYFEKASRKG